MTIRTKRRGRRSLAAILAAMLMASVLAVVAGSPAQAANTSGEYLVEGEREFAGSDRYQTALKLATRFADDRGGIGSVSAAFIASGESLVDAVSVSGLAGFMDAPVLLTQSGSLHGGVADYLEDYGIGNLYVLGGEAAVSGAVEDALKGLAHSPTVTRISGDTRYDTSAAIASNLSGESWCGTNENSAIIVNGSDEDLFNAVAIGPVANRLELPVLLTAGDSLVDAVVSYIESEDVEHAVVVGGEDSVSADVMTALGNAGVDTVERIGGDSAAAVSVAIAGVIGGDCADDLSPVSGNTVALINSDSVIDGIPAAPVLADDGDQLGGGLIPILAVGDSLPASVRDYLAATPEEDGAGNKVHLRVLAVGGTAAVSDAVMSAAVDAAASADALTVTISGAADKADAGLAASRGGTMIHLHFSDDISRATDANLRNKLEDVLQINGVPADVAADAPGTAAPCDPDTVTVTLERTLKAGDVVSIVEGAVLVGADGDRRPVQPTSATVPAAAVDNQRPTIRIVAIIGHTELYGLVSDDTALAETAMLSSTALTGTALSDLFEVTAGDVGIVSYTSSATFPTDGTAAPKTSLLTFTLGDDPNRDGTQVGTIDSSDRFRANRGAIEDASENESQVTTGVPVSPVSQLRVSSVQMSNLKHNAQAIAPIPSAHQGATAPDQATGRSVTQAQGNEAVWLQAKEDGAAAGAFGNGWTIRADRASTWDMKKDADIDVFISTKDRRIVVRIVNGEPTFSDLKAALEGNATVNSLFNVLVDNSYLDDNTDTCKAANHKLMHALLPVSTAEDAGDGDDIATLDGGNTQANIRVTFNGYVEDITAAQSTQLMTHVLADALKRATAAGVADQAALLTALTATTDDFVKAASAGPTRTGMFDISTGNAAALPKARDIVEIPDGFAKNADGTPTDSDTSTTAIDRTDSNSVANGYGDTAAGDNDWNYGSKIRIVTSSAVPAPE
ncbi:cell wall-binding repeat-containing protein [Candidatus Poriferisodalis sp.]|uniref:cell wall-binding repeat-containing protein n=1 Tax=Candidatus Poriferisodalis sp. TaxID=3101277 RepID=UPI003B01B455